MTEPLGRGRRACLLPQHGTRVTSAILLAQALNKEARSSVLGSGGATRSTLLSLNAGSASRKQAITTRASTIRSERALAIAYWRGAVSDGLIGVGVERDKDQESPFGGRLIGFRGEKPDAFVPILLDGEN